MPDGPGPVEGPSLTQMTAAMGVSRDLRAALKAVEKMEASLLRASYAVASVDDAGLRDDLLATTEKARRFFTDSTAKMKLRIKQDVATAGTVDKTGHRLPKHG